MVTKKDTKPQEAIVAITLDPHPERMAPEDREKRAFTVVKEVCEHYRVNIEPVIQAALLLKLTQTITNLPQMMSTQLKALPFGPENVVDVNGEGK